MYHVTCVLGVVSLVSNVLFVDSFDTTMYYHESRQINDER
jgi:hypothetical protein